MERGMDMIIVICVLLYFFVGFIIACIEWYKWGKNDPEYIYAYDVEITTFIIVSWPIWFISLLITLVGKVPECIYRRVREKELEKSEEK